VERVAVPDRAPAEAVAPSPAGLGRVPSPALVLGAIGSIQVGAAFARTAFDDFGSAGTSALRLGCAAVLMLVIVRPSLRGRRRADLALVVVFGLVLGAMNLTFYAAVARIPLGIAVTVEFLGPLAVALAGSRRAVDLLWVACAGAGVVLLAHPGGASAVDGLGLALALLAGVGWATYIVLGQRMGGRFAGADGSALAMILAAVVPLGPGIAQAGGALLTWHALWVGVVVGALSSALPYTLEIEALRRIPRHVFGVLMSLEPGVAALAGFLVLGQSLRAVEIAAIALVVFASIGASRGAAGAPPVEA
jgi:inner membrane transporter RhtA